MSERFFNKLVRDGVPDNIRSNGEEAVVRVLDDNEYKVELANKLTEEADEVRSAALANDRPGLIEELADLEEVRRALMREYEISSDQIEAKRQAKLELKGGFDKRQFLEKTMSPTEEPEEMI